MQLCLGHFRKQDWASVSHELVLEPEGETSVGRVSVVPELQAFIMHL